MLIRRLKENFTKCKNFYVGLLSPSVIATASYLCPKFWYAPVLYLSLLVWLSTEKLER